MDKHKIVIIGNCQARPIATLLEKMSDRIKVTKVAIVHLLKSEQENEYKQAFEEADYIIAQLVAPNYPCEFVRTDDLKDKYGNKVTTIVNLFFKGEQPDWVYIRDEQHKSLMGPLYEYHNLTILKCWFAGKSVAETEKYLTNVEYNYLEFENERKKSFEQLRVKEGLVDVKICDFIENNEHLFWTFNHPKNELLYEYAKNIFTHIFNNKYNEVKSNKEPLGKVRLPSNIINKKVDYIFDDIDIKNKKSNLADVFKKFFKVHNDAKPNIEPLEIEIPPSNIVDKKVNFIFDGFSVDNKKYYLADVIKKFFILYSENKFLVSKYISSSITKNKKTPPKVFFCFPSISELALSIPVKAYSTEISFKVQNNLLHLSNVIMEIHGEWHDLRSNLIKSLKLSSILGGEEKFSLESLKNKKSKFFSTKHEPEAYLKIEFSESVCITKIKVINRPEYSLWNRAKNMKITSKQGELTSVLFDNNNPLNINKVIESIFSKLEGSTKLSFLSNELLLMRLYLEKESLLEGHFFEKIILSMTDKIYLMISDEPSKYDEKIDDLMPFVILISNVKSLMSYTSPVLILVTYLIANNKRKDAFNIYKNVCTEWDVNQINKLKNIVDLMGKLKLGHSLVPATHSFSRPIRDWPRDLVLNTIDAILSSTAIHGVKCSFICYGTLLGLYRDKNFIAHDDDIDLLCVVDGGIESIPQQAEAIKVNLIKLGLKVRAAPTNDKNKLPFLLIFDPKHGIHTDLFFAYLDGEKIHLPMANVRYSEIDVSKVLPLATYNIWDKTFNVPNDIEYFLTERYGNTWNEADEFFRVKEK